MIHALYVMVYDFICRMDNYIISYTQDWKVLAHLSDIPDIVRICPGTNIM